MKKINITGDEGLMDSGKYTNDIDWEVKPSKCSKCGLMLEYKGNGEYICSGCGNVERDDFGKVRHYIEENGPSKATDIAAGTGVDISKINRYLKQGKIEIPEGGGPYIKCERCGCDIRYGRFCPSCALSMCNDMKVALDVGEVPRQRKNSGKMHFLGSDRD